jgi:hypothetical protein
MLSLIFFLPMLVLKAWHSRMPYVPPHLRSGYVKPKSPPKKNYTGKIHWPTNLNSHRPDNIVQPTRLYSPPAATSETLGLGVKKPIMKLVEPITPNIAPIARPSTQLAQYPPKFRNAVVQHLKKGTRKAAAKRPTKKTRAKEKKIARLRAAKKVRL